MSSALLEEISNLERIKATGDLTAFEEAKKSYLLKKEKIEALNTIEKRKALNREYGSSVDEYKAKFRPVPEKDSQFYSTYQNTRPISDFGSFEEYSQEVRPELTEVFKSNIPMAEKLKKFKEVIPGSDITVEKGKAYLKAPGQERVEVFKSGFKEFFTGKNKQEFELPQFKLANEVPGPIAQDYGMRTLFTHDTASMVDILKKQHPQVNIRYDIFGNPIAKLGNTEGYVNSKGTGVRDFTSTIAQGIGLLPAAKAPQLLQKGAAGLGLGRTASALGSTAGRVGVTVPALALNDLALQKATQVAGSDQPINQGQATATGLFGGAVEAVSPAIGRVYRNLRGIPHPQRPVVASTPETFFKDPITKERVNPNEHIRGSETSEFGIQVGQDIYSPQAATTVAGMRRGAKGEGAQKATLARDQKQADAVLAGLERIRGISSNKISGPSLDTEYHSVVKAVNSIKSRASEEADKTRSIFSQVENRPASFKKDNVLKYIDDVENLSVPKYQMKNGVASIQASPLTVTPELTPRAMRVLELLSNERKALTDKNMHFNVAGSDIKNIVNINRTINELWKDARISRNNADAEALNVFREKTQDLLFKSGADALHSGDVKTVELLKQAFNQHKKERELFGRKSNKSGATDTVGKDLERLVLDDVQPDQMIQMIIGRGAVGDKQGSIEMMRRVRAILKDKPEEFAAIQNLYMQRLISGVQDTKGGLRVDNTIKSIVNAVSDEKGANAALTRLVLEKHQIDLLKKLAIELNIARPQMIANPSGTAHVIEGMTKKAIQDAGKTGGAVSIGVGGVTPEAIAAIVGPQILNSMKNYFAKKKLTLKPYNAEGKLPNQLFKTTYSQQQDEAQ